MLTCQTQITTKAITTFVDFSFKRSKFEKFRRIFVNVLSVFLLLISSFSLLAQIFADRKATTGFILFMIFIAVFAIVAVWYINFGLKKLRIRALTKQKSASDKPRIFKYTFSETAFKAESLKGSSSYKWTAFTKFYETDRYYFAGVDSLYYTIDKAGFAENGLNQFRDLLAKVLPIPIKRV